MAEAPRLSVRIPEPTRQMAIDKAAKQGMTISHVIRLLVDEWVNRESHDQFVRRYD